MPPRPLAFAMLVEAVLVLFTLLMLVQPRAAFQRAPERVSRLATASGLVLLCLTFCWSVIVGMLSSLYNTSLPF